MGPGDFAEDVLEDVMQIQVPRGLILITLAARRARARRALIGMIVVLPAPFGPSGQRGGARLPHGGSCTQKG